MNTVVNRIKSLTRYKGLLSEASLGANALLGILPDEMEIPGMPNLYVEGLVQEKVTITEGEKMSISFDGLIRNRNCPAAKNDSHTNYNWAYFEPKELGDYSV